MDAAEQEKITQSTHELIEKVQAVMPGYTIIEKSNALINLLAMEVVEAGVRPADAFRQADKFSTRLHQVVSANYAGAMANAEGKPEAEQVREAKEASAVTGAVVEIKRGADDNASLALITAKVLAAAGAMVKPCCHDHQHEAIDRIAQAASDMLGENPLNLSSLMEQLSSERSAVVGTRVEIRTPTAEVQEHDAPAAEADPSTPWRTPDVQS